MDEMKNATRPPNWPSMETDDAAEWAQAMSESLIDELRGIKISPTPGGLLHAWLCNAIETGRAFGVAQEARTGQHARSMAAALGPKGAEKVGLLKEKLELANYTIRGLREEVRRKTTSDERNAEQLDRWRARAKKFETERDELRAAVNELSAADEVLVEGSFFPRQDLPRILGNFMRSNDQYAREAKDLRARLKEAHAANQSRRTALTADDVYRALLPMTSSLLHLNEDGVLNLVALLNEALA